MSIVDIADADWTIQSFDVNMSIGTVHYFHDGRASFYGHIAMQFFCSQMTGIGLDTDVGIHRNLHFVFDDSGLWARTLQQMRNDINAIVALALIQLDLVRMKYCAHHNKAVRSRAHNHGSVGIINGDHRMLADLEPQVFMRLAGCKCGSGESDNSYEPQGALRGTHTHSPKLLAATVHSQFIQHLLLLVSVDQHLLRVNVVRVVFQGLFSIPNEGVCLIQVGAIARNLRRRT